MLCCLLDLCKFKISIFDQLISFDVLFVKVAQKQVKYNQLDNWLRNVPYFIVIFYSINKRRGVAMKYELKRSKLLFWKTFCGEIERSKYFTKYYCNMTFLLALCEYDDWKIWKFYLKHSTCRLVFETMETGYLCVLWSRECLHLSLKCIIW